MIRVKCPTCDKTMTAPESAAGKRGKCPNCREALQIPAATALQDLEVVKDFEVVDDFEIVTEAAPAKPRPNAISPQRRPAEIPTVEAVVEERPQRKRRRDDDEDDDYDDEDDYDRPRRRKRVRRGPKDGTPVGRGGYAICYNCGADAASKVGFTWWGGLVGPAILSHVRCSRCGTTYNGRSGKSNNTAIGIYIGVGFAIAAGLGLLAVLNAALQK